MVWEGVAAAMVDSIRVFLLDLLEPMVLAAAVVAVDSIQVLHHQAEQEVRVYLLLLSPSYHRHPPTQHSPSYLEPQP
jgi:hypothetical protein